MSNPKRRKEDKAVISYKTLAIGAVALVITLVGHVHLSDTTGLHKKMDDYAAQNKEDKKEIKAQLVEIRKDTSEIGLLRLEIKHLQKDRDRMEGDIADVKKKYLELDKKIEGIKSFLVEDK